MNEPPNQSTVTQPTQNVPLQPIRFRCMTFGLPLDGGREGEGQRGEHHPRDDEGGQDPAERVTDPDGDLTGSDHSDPGGNRPGEH